MKHNDLCLHKQLANASGGLENSLLANKMQHISMAALKVEAGEIGNNFLTLLTAANFKVLE